MYQRKIDFFVPPPAGWYRNRNCIRQWTYSEVTTTENPVTCSPFKRKAVRSTKRVRDLRFEEPWLCHSLAGERWYAVPKGGFEIWGDFRLSGVRWQTIRQKCGEIPFLTIEAGCVVQGDFSILWKLCIESPSQPKLARVERWWDSLAYLLS